MVDVDVDVERFAVLKLLLGRQEEDEMKICARLDWRRRRWRRVVFVRWMWSHELGDLDATRDEVEGTR